jgi:hypothetical protein
MVYAPVTWSFGEVVTSSKLNTMAANDDHLKAILDGFVGVPWTTYTPALTADTTSPSGAMSPTGKYVKIGRFVLALFQFSFGAGFSAGSGAYRVSLPVPAVVNPQTAGGVRLYGAAKGSTMGRVAVANTAYLTMQYITPQSALGAFGTLSNVVHAAPWAWASGDIIDGFVYYEATS